MIKTSIVVTPIFRKEAKKLIKKYHSLKGELEELRKNLMSDPTKGILITENTYKIRLAVKSKGKGKSGGLRIITFVFSKIESEETIINLLHVYDKSNLENIPEKLLDQSIESAKKSIEEIDADPGKKEE